LAGGSITGRRSHQQLRGPERAAKSQRRGRYRMSFRAEFYNLFNRHYYNINGCGGNNSNGIGAADYGEIYGVQDNPRSGQFAIRFDF
jgi:hypothetical protein